MDPLQILMSILVGLSGAIAFVLGTKVLSFPRALLCKRKLVPIVVAATTIFLWTICTAATYYTTSKDGSATFICLLVTIFCCYCWSYGYNGWILQELKALN